MKKISHYLFACCLVTFGVMPSNAFATYALTMANSFKGSILPSSTLYLNSGNTMQSFCNLDSATSLTIPASGRITDVYGNIFCAEAASQETCTINILLNGTAVTQVTNSLSIVSAGQNPFLNSNLNVYVQAGDVLQMQIITPAWTQLPNSCSFSVSLLVQ